MEALLDRENRRRWMRSTAMSSLVHEIVQTASVSDGLQCILDETLGRWRLPSLATAIAKDRRAMAAALRRAIAAARRRRFEAVALVIADGEPYQMSLALVDEPVDVGSEWTDAIAWRSAGWRTTAVLDAVMAGLPRRPPSVRAEVDYAVPLAYGGLLLSDGLARIAHPKIRSALASYMGGDCVAVPTPAA